MKRLILALLTIISLVPFVLSLVGSVEEPQVQTQLQLSQVNLLLEATAGAELMMGEAWENSVKTALLDSDPYGEALTEYETAAQALKKSFSPVPTPSTDSLEVALDSPDRQRTLKRTQQQWEQVQINLGLLQAHAGQSAQALQTWQAIAQQSPDPDLGNTAQELSHLYQGKPVDPDAPALFQRTLKGWFQQEALGTLYRRQGNFTDPQTPCNTPDCQALTEQIQRQGQQALIKLGLLNTLPLAGGGLGTLLLIGLLVQWALKGKDSLLATHAHTRWQTPWTGETLWQVFVVGFLLASQILLPLTLGLLPLSLDSLSLMGKALYVLATYGAIAGWGIGVLWLSLKAFRPLPEDWFRIGLSWGALGWGVGGYLVALPLVVLVSLFNQALWQGQGGSNPLLSLALDSQNWVVLGIFFFTAAILAPLFEEIMFRGFLLPSLTRYVPVGGAIVISSLLFAIAHLNLSEVLPLFVLGCVLGTVYSRSRNLLASMVLHGLWNSGTLISLFILGSS